jgi:hypothetical protein
MPNPATLTPTEPFALGETNVSQPSLVVQEKASQQSITASEDYYSLSEDSASSGRSDRTARRVGAGQGAGGAGEGLNVLQKYTTPPSRYRTPAQSREFLAAQQQQQQQEQQVLVGQGQAGAVGGGDGTGEWEGGEEVRKTPMRGQGKRRASVDAASTHTATAGPSNSNSVLRGEGGVRRQAPQASSSATGAASADPDEAAMIDPFHARSSVARDLERDTDSPPTPGLDDTPYIRFALDQLTRDEEVRGSRRYGGYSSYAVPGAYPAEAAGPSGTARPAAAAPPSRESVLPRAPVADVGPSKGEAERARMWSEPDAVPVPVPAVPAQTQQREQETPEQKARFLDEPPPRNPRRPHSPALGGPVDGAIAAGPAYPDQLPSGELFPPPLQPRARSPQDEDEVIPEGGDTFIAIPSLTQHLTFVPGVLRPIQLGVFLFLVLAYIVCLVFSAIWSLTHTGILDYASFGDVRYFVFEYVPTLLGLILWFWTVQIELAVYRVAPFAAMSSEDPRARVQGSRLPLVPKGFVLPYLGHFAARQWEVGCFVLVAWLQLWTVPLLASSFNVHFNGSGSSGKWQWIATQGPIWAVIGLYVLLLLAVILLFVWLKGGRRVTGLRWDPRSIADLIVLLESSNALDETAEQHEPAQLAYWRTAARPGKVSHTYGITERAARRYGVEGGRIQEKPVAGPSSGSNQPIMAVPPPPTSRFSAPGDQSALPLSQSQDLDLEAGEGQRHSREKMLPRPGSGEETENGNHRRGARGLIPWFLQPFFASLWPIIAIVLLIAFLIVSYLSSTAVANGFTPLVPAVVSRLGFSSTNFLYSFVPALLGMLCVLFWMNIDYAYRRLQVYIALAGPEEGELAERSLLLSYAADLPVFVTASAVINRHWRIALLSFITLLSAALPILGGGVFWAQFYVNLQKTRISAHMPAYYALTVFCVLFALAWLAIWPSKGLREASHELSKSSSGSSLRSEGRSFEDMKWLVRQSKILDEFAFHATVSRIDLFTRLLSPPPGMQGQQKKEAAGTGGLLGVPEAGASKLSVADSIRGFGDARSRAQVSSAAGRDGVNVLEPPRYYLGTYTGRDGGMYYGIDRVRL